MTGGPVPDPPAPYPPSVPPPAPPYPSAPYPPAPYPQVPLPASAPPYGHPAYPWYVHPQPPAPSRRGRWPWVAAALAVALAATGAVVALWPRPGSPAALWHVAGEQEAPPSPDAAAATWNAWARRMVDALIVGQADALVAGDEEAYLAPVDPRDERLRETLQHRYEMLREMGVGIWRQQIRGRPEVTGEFSWHADVRVTYCFGDATCRPNSVVIGTDWRLSDDHLVLTDVTNSGTAQLGPRPWETDLAITTGARTVVATSPRLSDRLSDALQAAEQAAAVADTLAKWEAPPSRYVLFLASGADWQEWYGFPKPDWAGGIYLDETDNEVLVNSGVRYLKDILTHEFTHVATLAGDRKGANDASSWWLTEGIAEYAMMIGRPVTDYVGLAETRAYRRSHGADPVVAVPADDDSTEDVAGAYGVAFLSIRRLSDRFGEDAMLTFFGLVVHDGLTVEEAAPTAFGQEWTAVRDDCATYVRSV